jgi:hypothetical protein
MILKDCEDIATLVLRYQDHHQKVGLVETLRPRREQLETLRDEFATEVVRIDLFREHNVLSDNDLHEVSSMLDKALESLTKVRNGFDSDPINLTRGRDYRYLCERYASVNDSLKTLAREAWREYAKKACPAVDEGTLRRFDRTERDAVRAIRDVQRRTDVIRKRLPASESEFQEANLAFDELRGSLAKLPNVSHNSEVIAFLDATIQEDGAALSLLTPAVRQWLSDEGREGQYRIWAAMK